MSRERVILFGLSLVIMAGTAAWLVKARSQQRLGAPGVRVVREPILDETGAVAARQSVYLPPVLLDGESLPLPITRLELDWLPPDTTYGRRQYRWPGKPDIQVSVVLMGGDRTSIHKPEFCLAGQGWAFRESEIEETSIPVPKPFPYQLPLRKIVATSTVGEAQRGFYVFWFVNDREISASHGGRMWSQALHLLRTGEMERWAYISFFARCLPGQEEATWAWLRQVIAEAAPLIQIPPAAAAPARNRAG